MTTQSTDELVKRVPHIEHDDLCVWWDNVGKEPLDYACTCGKWADTIERLQRLAPLCNEHGSGNGARSGCPYCALIKMSAALSRIDYLCGPPNDMEVSGYDVHCNENCVVEAVDRLQRELAARDKTIEALEVDVRWIHQKLKRGEATQDHGLKGNLRCIIDHLADAARSERGKPHE